jgi:chromosome condensin MukBEF MukE localization factor
MSIAFYEAYALRIDGTPEFYYLNPRHSYLIAHFFLLNTQYLVGDAFLVRALVKVPDILL